MNIKKWVRNELRDQIRQNAVPTDFRNGIIAGLNHVLKKLVEMEQVESDFWKGAKSVTPREVAGRGKKKA